jgi:putative ABC transport system substrate-binding protein
MSPTRLGRWQNSSKAFAGPDFNDQKHVKWFGRRPTDRAEPLELLIHDIQSADDIPAAFDAGLGEGAEGVLTTVESIFAAQGKRVAQLALEYKLPGLYPYRSMVEAGGLMAFDSYTSDFQALTATYVDKILKGTKPSDLPVQQPTKFELFINMRTAKMLGLTIPSSLIVRADELID